MPLYDLVCEACNLVARDQRLASGYHPPCAGCGQPTIYLWDVAPNVIDDQLPNGPQWFENLGHHPVFVETKTQLKQEMAARKLQPFVRHIGKPGSDKSDKTSRWV